MFRKLLSFDEAKIIIEKNVSNQPIGTEKATLSNAHERILAQDIISLNNIPPFNRSIVDGYAVKAKDTFGVSSFNPKLFTLTKNEIHENEASELWTGNPIPKGADAVVMLEYTKKTNDKIIT